MATFSKFNCFVENLAEGVHNLQSHQLTVTLTDVSPSNAANAVITDITACTGLANLGAASARNISLAATSPSTQAAGVYKLVVQDLVLTASPAVGPFRYAVVYNSTASTSPLIGFYDYGSSITLNTGETLTLDFDQSAGLLTLQ
jgi:hypothetical protein